MTSSLAVDGVPLTWRCGVDNNFGWLTGRDGTRRLCELHVIWFVTTAEVVCLHTGQRLTIPADGSWRWEPIAPAQACAIVGLPAPAVDGRAELDRRTDPFHVERHRSPLFAALVKTICARQLPVGHALRELAAGAGWDGEWVGACYQAPEVFAAAVNRLASRPDGPDALTAVGAVLDDDLRHLPAPERSRVLSACGWREALPVVADAIAAHAARIPTFAEPAGGQLGLDL